MFNCNLRCYENTLCATKEKENKEGELLNKVIIFVFFVPKSILVASHGLFYRCPWYVSGPRNITVVLLSMKGHRALRFHQKYLNLCSEDERRSCSF